MPRTLSGHLAITSTRNPLLAARKVPGRPITLRTHRAYLPLFLRLAVLLDQVEPLQTRNTWSFNYRPARLGKGVSDHSGYAIDCWSDGIGANTTIANNRMPAKQAAEISKLLKQFRTKDGRLIFGWGVSDQVKGVDYPLTYHRLNDPMHIYIASGITPTDALLARRRLGIKPDGTVKR